MNSFSDTTCLLLVLLLLDPVQMLVLPGNERPRVMGLWEVLSRSSCRPVEQHVSLEREFPDATEYIFIPRCVSLFRCSGCCNDEALECYPSVERNITLEVIRNNQQVNLTFVEHQECGQRRIARYERDTSSVDKSLRKRPQMKKHRRTRRSCEKCK